MFDPRERYMQDKEDGRCPFCGTEVENFPVCKGCRAEKIWSDGPKSNVLYDTIYFSILVPVLLYFRKTIFYYFEFVVDMFEDLPDYAVVGLDYGFFALYYGFVAFCLYGLCACIYDWCHFKNFFGLGWKKR